jgi:ATP-binding protein involved in chromosome partitioning
MWRGVNRHLYHTGTVIVSTPQDVALADVRKGIAAFQKLSVPVCPLPYPHFFIDTELCLFLKVTGLVLNQSYFLCPTCNTPHHLFGSSDACKGLGIELLGELPLTPGVSTGGDAGLPYTLFNSRCDTDGVSGQRWREAMLDITERVWEALHTEQKAL